MSSARARARCRPSSASRRASSGRRSRSARRRSTSLRGSGGHEKVLKNAKDAAATEALEIATYTSIERLAKVAGDDKTAQLAASILADEEKMLARILREIPQLTVDGGRRQVLRRRHHRRRRDRQARGQGRPSGRLARRARCPGVAQAEGQVKGAVASESDLAIARYDALTADEIVSRLSRPLAGRPGQGRHLRAPAREPHDGARPHLFAARRRAVAGLRRAQRVRGPVRARRGRRRPPASACARTSARTRTAPACSTPPSASSATPDPSPARGA